MYAAITILQVVTRQVERRRRRSMTVIRTTTKKSNHVDALSKG